MGRFKFPHSKMLLSKKLRIFGYKLNFCAITISQICFILRSRKMKIQCILGDGAVGVLLTNGKTKGHESFN